MHDVVILFTAVGYCIVYSTRLQLQESPSVGDETASIFSHTIIVSHPGSFNVVIFELWYPYNFVQTVWVRG